ncbi:hypothetical protein LCGC14_0313620 [marine sediment metagenome]|uniref:Uncharacterized protein n=1 Tax=marine sediment metagenome TaxID=412755 RepID=A0A0F9TLR9_9ZZZZ
MERGAFGWPTGSVRAVLAFIVIGPTVGALVYLATASASEAALTALVGLAMGSIGYYFGKSGAPPA